MDWLEEPMSAPPCVPAHAPAAGSWVSRPPANGPGGAWSGVAALLATVSAGLRTAVGSESQRSRWELASSWFAPRLVRLLTAEGSSPAP